MLKYDLPIIGAAYRFFGHNTERECALQCSALRINYDWNQTYLAVCVREGWQSVLNPRFNEQRITWRFVDKYLQNTKVVVIILFHITYLKHIYLILKLSAIFT